MGCKFICFCFRVSYKDGVMEHEPKACAAVKGTQIMVRTGKFGRGLF